MPSTKLHGLQRERIGSFQSLEGAARAVSHLVELRYDPDDVAIEPKRFEVVARGRLRDRLRRGFGRGALVGALTMSAAAVTTAIGLDRLVRSILPSVAIAAGVGACIGIVAAVVHHRRSSFLADVSSAPQLRPTTFDVVVDRRQTDAARHDLARWWDPAAPPVQRQHVA